jgi:nitroreductase
MELYDVMRTTFAARDFTDEPLPDATLFKILGNARFAPNGGNRQGWQVIIVRNSETKAALSALAEPAAKRYTAQVKVGENPWNTIDPTSVDAETIAQTEPTPALIQSFLKAAVVLVVAVDLKVVASMDQYLDRVGMITGASVYPFIWNVLMAARHEGFGGTITTLAVAQEPKVKELLGIPAHYAVSAIIPMGKPVKQLTKLRRNPVSSFTTREHWDGEVFGEEG